MPAVLVATERKFLQQAITCLRETRYMKLSELNTGEVGVIAKVNGHGRVDVTFKEDACRARKGFAAQNLSTVRKMALQIVKAHSDNRSIRKRLFRASLSQDYLLELLRGARI